MFNVFSLTEAVNNAANGNISDITPHAYIGTMEEACEDFRYMLMTEAAEQAEFYARSEEIITEAAFSNPDTVGVLVENVFSNMGTRIKEFFAKLKKWILGLIDTMKATFFQFTKKTSEWLKIMGPRIDAARGRTGHSDFTYEMHEWKTDYVISGMSKAFSQLLANWPKQSKVGQMSTHSTAQLVSNISGLKDYTTKTYDNADADSDKVKSFVKMLNDAAEEYKKAVEDDTSEFPKAVANALGGSLSTATLDDLWRSLDAEVRGGEKKTTMKIDGKVDEMRKAIEGYKNSFNEIEKAYKEYIKVINQDEKKLTDDYNQAKKFDVGDKKIPSSVITALQQNWAAKYNAITSMYNRLSGTASKMQSLNISYIKAMVGEYMSALTAYSRLKEVKEK